ncbi:hypothetical protein QUB60_20870 [Microcoleus sp. A2-C5]
MNSPLLIFPYNGSGFKPILSGNQEFIPHHNLRNKFLTTNL